MTRSVLIATALACAIVPAAAQPAPPPPSVPPGPPCLQQRTMHDFHPAPGNRALVVTDLARHRYRVSFMGECYGLQFQTGLAFKTFGVSSLSCVSKGDQVLVRNPGGPRQCIVQSVTYQTPAMDRADLAAAAKKH